jgi:hypothetical protein
LRVKGATRAGWHFEWTNRNARDAWPSAMSCRARRRAMVQHPPRNRIYASIATLS